MWAKQGQGAVLDPLGPEAPDPRESGRVFGRGACCRVVQAALAALPNTLQN
jgi:hypothetical protein